MFEAETQAGTFEIITITEGDQAAILHEDKTVAVDLRKDLTDMLR